MIDVIAWLLVVEAIGVATLPFAVWLLRALPDRGVAFAKPLGILLVGFLVWFGASLGLLRHTQSTAIAAILCLGIAGWLGLGHRTVSRIGVQRRALLVAELVFIVAFVLAALLRAGNPEIFGTEKPMDFAFLNASIRGDQVPPEDPWLSGYGISYYYFGYFLMAFVAKTASVPGPVAFNLALATLFALTASGAYGLVSNLVAGRELTKSDHQATATSYGVLAAVFVLLLSNLEGLLELLNVNNVLPVGFWQWLGIKDLTGPRPASTWYPTDPPDTWWWWRASRVVGDFDPATGVTRDYTINEFPFFSFLLGDLHPHVMALPFVLLALSMVLAALKENTELSFGWLAKNPGRAATYVIVFGALGFINSWDMPTAIVVLVLCVTAQRALIGSASRGPLVRKAFGLGVLLVVAAMAVYLPFYVGFRTQASGFGWVETRTKLQHFLVMWAPLLFTASAFPLGVFFAGAGRDRRYVVAGGGVSLALALVAGFVNLQSAGLPGALQGLPTTILIVALLAPAVIVYWRTIGPRGAPGALERPEEIFVLVIVAAALGLLGICEFAFIRDGFGNRMNTVFKFYYQAWVLLAAAAAYALYYFDLRRRLAGWSGRSLLSYRVWRAAAAVLLVCGFIYTALAPLSKVGNPVIDLTLNGLAWLRSSDPGEYEAIIWLSELEGSPVILETSGGSYSDFNRVAAFTGLPSVLGWAGHEYQWRGQTPEPAQRKADIDTIYGTPDTATAGRLLARYRVAYVYVGPRERQTYSGAAANALTKFSRLGAVAFQNERVTIYAIDQ